jgi:thymidylate synthase (FAD)
MDTHAQREVRDYAVAIGEQIVSKWVTLVWEAFVDYGQRSVRLSRIEVEIMSALVAGSADEARSAANRFGLLRVGKNGKLTANRERKEVESKLRLFGFTPPWE